MTQTLPIIVKTAKANLGDLLCDMNQRKQAAVQVAADNVTIKSITQLGTGKGVQFDGAKKLRIGLLDCSNGVPRDYGFYSGGDNKACEDCTIETFIVHVADGPDPETTGDDGQHGGRQMNHKRQTLGHATRRLNVPADHPGHPARGFAGYIDHDSDYAGEALKMCEGEELLVQWVKTGHEGEHGAVKVGPLPSHLNNPDKPLEFRRAVRSRQFTFDHCEHNVGKRYFTVEAGTENLLVIDTVIRAKGGDCLDLKGERTSDDGLVVHPAPGGAFVRVHFIGKRLASTKSLPSLENFEFTECRFTDEDNGRTYKLGLHGEQLEEIKPPPPPRGPDRLDQAKDLLKSKNVEAAVELVIDELRAARGRSA